MAAAAATAQQETRAGRIQLQCTLMQSEHSNHDHRYLPSPAHTHLINNTANDVPKSDGKVLMGTIMLILYVH